MVRVGAVLGVLGVLVLTQAVRAEPVPAALQGRWGKPADCAKPGAGMTIGPDKMVIVDGPEPITIMVEASEVHDGQARLTIKSVSGGRTGPGPKAGDSIVVRRTGSELRPVEGVIGGARRDMSNEPPIGLCAS